MAEQGMRSAEPPAAEKETKDPQVRALHDAVRSLARRVDALMARRSDDDDKHARIDEGEDKEEKEEKEEEKEEEESREDAKKDDKDIEAWAEEEKKEPQHKEEPEPTAADAKKDDTKKDDDRRRDDRRDDWRRDDDDRARADRAMARRLDELERRFSRARSDDEIDRLAELQTQWDRVAMAHGERAARPMDGETPLTYDRRHAKRFQKHSEKYRKFDLDRVPEDMLVAIVTPEIRTDAVEAAKRPEPGVSGGLREVVDRDVRTGRTISRFYGPVSETLAPFRLPGMRAQFPQRSSQQY
jgi:hypothetical protein